MNNFEVLKEGDVVKVFISDEYSGYYILKKIEFDKEDECGLWWSVTLKCINWFDSTITWKIDDNHLHQEPFYLDGNKLQIVLYARPGIIPKEKKEELIEKFNFSLF